MPSHRAVAHPSEKTIHELQDGEEPSNEDDRKKVGHLNLAGGLQAAVKASRNWLKLFGHALSYKAPPDEKKK